MTSPLVSSILPQTELLTCDGEAAVTHQEQHTSSCQPAPANDTLKREIKQLLEREPAYMNRGAKDLRRRLEEVLDLAPNSLTAMKKEINQLINEVRITNYERVKTIPITVTANLGPCMGPTQTKETIHH